MRHAARSLLLHWRSTFRGGIAPIAGLQDLQTETKWHEAHISWSARRSAARKFTQDNFQHGYHSGRSGVGKSGRHMWRPGSLSSFRHSEGDLQNADGKR